MVLTETPKVLANWRIKGGDAGWSASVCAACQDRSCEMRDL